MYAVEIRDHVMIAHSLAGAVFGPAQQLHGATYIVDVCFQRPELDVNDIVVDIGRAGEVVKRILAQINFANLDDHPAFRGRRSTTEAVTRWVFDEVAAAIGDGRLGAEARGITRVKVTLHESHVASASLEGDVPRG
jgi:6-pyruvoyl-tetrahydropterin synthase